VVSLLRALIAIALVCGFFVGFCDCGTTRPHRTPETTHSRKQKKHRAITLATRRSSGVMPLVCVRVYASVLVLMVPPRAAESSNKKS